MISTIPPQSTLQADVPTEPGLVANRQVQVLENFEIRYGPAPAWVRERVEAIDDAERLRQIARIVLTSDTLDELFAAL